MGCALRSSILLFPVVLAYAQPGTGTGTVMGITGNWRLGAQELRFGSHVALGATLSCDPGSTLQLGVADANPPVRLVARCDDSKTFALKSARQQAEPQGVFKRLQAAAEPYSHRSPEGLVAAVSRDFGRDPGEAVAPLRDGRVDLAQAFRDTLSGAYLFRLAPLGGPPAGASGPPLAAQWTSGAALEIPAANLAPGIYRLTVLDSSGQPGSEAWVLICAPAEYGAASAEFAQALDLVSQWSGDFDPAAMRPILRAFLQSLAADPKGR